MDIVDSQVHIGPGGIDRMLGAMDALGIKAALIHEAWTGTPNDESSSEASIDGMPNGPPSYKVSVTGQNVWRQTSPTAELASLTYPGRFAYLLPINRRDPELCNLIRLLRDSPHGRALRIGPGINKNELSILASGGYDEMFKEAADCGLPIFVTIPGNAPVLRAAAAKFRSVTFIIDHCGMPFDESMQKGLAAKYPGLQFPEMGSGTNQAAFDRVLRMADLPNIALKWAHAQGLFGVIDYPYEDLRSSLKSAINAFGSDRVMWASDVTVNRTGDSWAQLLFWIINNPDLSDSDRANLLGGSVRKLLNWR